MGLKDIISTNRIKFLRTKNTKARDNLKYNNFRLNLYSN